MGDGNVVFQLLTARLEDRYPRGFLPEERRVVIASPDTFEGRYVEKSAKGCVAILFGRTRDGTSVAVRIENVMPKLYYERAAGEDGLEPLRSDLQREVGRRMQPGERIELRHVQFSHFYYYEFDGASPSGRKVHDYVEASYPSLSTWKEAIALRKRHDITKLTGQLEEERERLRSHREELLTVRREAMRGTDAWADIKRRVADLEADIEHIEQETIPFMERRLQKIGQDDPVHVSGTSPPRVAQEQFVEPLSRFFYEENVRPGGWYCLSAPRPADVRVTTCDEELVCERGALRPVDENVDAPYSLCYYDIETLGKDPKDQPVIQVSLVFQQQGRPHEKMCVAVGTVDKSMLSDATIVECTTEAELLCATARIVRERDPDFMVAYFGINFDNRYLGVRAGSSPTECNPEVRSFWFLSRYGLRPSPLQERRLQSAGMGDNRINIFDLPGRTSLDWWVKLTRDPDLQSEPSYSLGHFAKKFCADDKKPMDYAMIPVLQSGSPQDRALLAEYCIHDSYLLLLLNDARNMAVEILRFANVFSIVPEWVFFRGQQVRYISMLLRCVRTQERVPMLINRPAEGFEGEQETSKYQGAIVVDPKRGFYKTCVAAVDFMSLYPSSMIANNLCPSTQVKHREAFGAEWEGRISTFQVAEGRQTHFVTTAFHTGILPIVQRELSQRRSAAKKEMKKWGILAKDASLRPDERARAAMISQINNGTQLALKVASNSMYGSMGAGISGLCPNRAVAETTTSCGRSAMMKQQQIIHDEYPGTTTIYGDTDSLFLTFDGVNDVNAAMEKGTAIAQRVTDYFSSIDRPLVLEMEKVYSTFLLLDKKRYAGVKYEEDASGAIVCKGIDAKGIETEKRDTVPFLKDLLRDVLADLFERGSPELAIASLRRHMDMLVNDQIPFEKYIIRKKLSSKVEHKTDTIPQAKVNADRKRREKGSEVALNDYVEMVMVVGHRDERTTHLAEDASYAKECGIPINRLWYFEHSVENPICKILHQIEATNVKALIAEYVAKLNAARLNTSDILKSSRAPSSSADGDTEASPRHSVAQRAAAIHVPAPKRPPPRSQQRRNAPKRVK